MASTFFSASPMAGNTQLFKLGGDQSVTQWTAGINLGGFPNPFDLTEFDGNVWFSGNTAAQGNQLYKLGFDGSVTKWTAINPGGGGLVPSDLTEFNDALWFGGFAPGQGRQLYKLGNDGSVTKWTALNMAGGLVPSNLTDFNNAMWFDGNTAAQGNQLYKLGFDGSVTQWTAINPGGGGLDRGPSSEFNGALWFGGAAAGQGNQLYKLGNDGSVTKWTVINPGGVNPNRGPGFDPVDINFFEGAAWFNGVAGAIGGQLYKLGADGSVTQWTAILDPTGIGPTPGGSGIFTNFQDALWFGDAAPGQGRQLYKLGNDGSVTKWTALSTGLADGLDPRVPFVFNDAVWFNGNAADGTRQLFKLGNDGSVTQWTAVAGGFNPQLVSQGAGFGTGDPDSTPSSIFEDAAWLSGRSNATGQELYKLGADGSVTFWKDINPGVGSSNPTDWARFA